MDPEGLGRLVRCTIVAKGGYRLIEGWHKKPSSVKRGRDGVAKVVSSRGLRLRDRIKGKGN